MFIFALYMASISFLKLQSVCLFCTSLYVVNIGLLVGAIVLIRSSKTSKTFNQPQFAYGLISCAVLIGGISWWQTQQAQAYVSPFDFIAPPPERIETSFVNYYNEQREVAVQGEERHIKGESGALLTITEFVDFRCPSCAIARDFLAQLYATNPGAVRVIFHHYPLDQSCNPIDQQVHPSACAAAIASECASDQDRFWDYADRLFADQKANPRRFTREDFTSHAEALDLDRERFNTCLDDPRMEERVRKDVEEGRRLEIKATPTLIINGRVIEGLPPPKKLATLITMAKQKK
jgi:protein-disulfide isomerase